MTDNVVYRRYSTFGKEVQFNNDALGGRIANIEIDAVNNNISFLPVFGEVIFKNINSVTCDGDVLFKDTPSITTDAQKVYGVATGTIIMYPSNSVPSGWFLCNGQSVSKTTYSKLYGFIGDTYGSTVNTFNVPDMKDRCVIQQDSASVSYDTLGKVGGVNELLLQETNIPYHAHEGVIGNYLYCHNHTYTATRFYENSKDSSPYGNFRRAKGKGNATFGYANAISNHTHSLTTSSTIYSNSSGTQVSNIKSPINNTYPSQKIKYIIKY